MPDAIAAKVCSVCGVDCSTMKRAKDASGRYICGECLERAREAKVAAQGKPIVVATGPIVPKTVAPPLTKDGVDPILDDLLAKSTANDMVACTECGFPIQGKAVICTHCGFNKNSGRAMRTQVVAAPKEKKEKSSRRTSFYISPFALFLLITCSTVGLILGGLFGQMPILFIAGVGVSALASIYVAIGLLVDAFRNSAVSGILILCSYFVPFLGLYTLWYVLTQADERIKMGYLANVVSAITILVAFFMNAIPAFGTP